MQSMSYIFQKLNVATRFAHTFSLIVVFTSSILVSSGSNYYAYDSLNRLTNVDYGNGSVISYTYDAAGNRLTYSGKVANDTIAPSIAISIPTSGSTFTTTNSIINLSGTASDNTAVSLIAWANDRGGLGTAIGTNSWNISSVHLQTGANVISVTAYDAAGNNTPATLTVTLVVALPPPPVLTGMSVSNGLVLFALNGPVGSNYVILASSNFVNWSVLLTNVIPEDGIRAIDIPILTNQPKMFYRALPLAQGPLVLQPGPVDSQDIWTTSVYSYAMCLGSYFGGGLNDFRLRVGGWGDLYYSLLQFNLTGLPTNASSAVLYLYCENLSGGGTPLFFDRITSAWDWRTSGTGCDRLRLWWADKPSAIQWAGSQLPTPSVSHWYAVDITTLYNAWQNGTYPNYGVRFRPVLNSNNNFDEFYSADYLGDPTLRPKLVITPGN